MLHCSLLTPIHSSFSHQNGDIEYAEQLSKLGLETALDVYGEDTEDPKYKELSEVFGYLTSMSDNGENPIGDAMGSFGV